MSRTIFIELAPAGEVGTRATVTTKRFLRRARVDGYVCHRGARLLSAQWINEATGEEADGDLQMALNNAAQAAARLAGRA